MLRQIILGFRQLTFIGTFEMLLSNNVPISDALETCAITVKNTPLEKELLTVKTQMALGLNLGEAIRKYTSVDPQLSHMLEIGEKASNLTEQLRLLRDLYEEETDPADRVLYRIRRGGQQNSDRLGDRHDLHRHLYADRSGRAENDEFRTASRKS